MDTTMAISGEKIKALREARAWSQAHLAEAAALSLRTVQRVEAEGTASAETRLAIAAALGVPVGELNVEAPAIAPEASRDRPYPGSINTLLLFFTFGAGLLFALWLGGRLPSQVASHFGAAGDANGHMSRDGFVAFMCVTMVGVPILMWTSLGRAITRQQVKIPHASYWFAPPRRPATVRFLYRRFTWFCTIMTAFMGYVFWLVAVANAGAPANPALDMRLVWAGLAVFLAVVAAWVTTLNAHFRRDDA
jgi:transcriptional regulator with XRE-family HTH domain